VVDVLVRQVLVWILLIGAIATAVVVARFIFGGQPTPEEVNRYQVVGGWAATLAILFSCLAVLLVAHDREDPVIALSSTDAGLRIEITNRGGRSIQMDSSYFVCGDDPNERTQIVRFSSDPVRRMSIDGAPFLGLPVRAALASWRDALTVRDENLTFEVREPADATTLAFFESQGPTFFCVLTKSGRSARVDLRKNQAVIERVRSGRVAPTRPDGPNVETAADSDQAPDIETDTNGP
jgi:hypothetical protein